MSRLLARHAARHRGDDAARLRARAAARRPRRLGLRARRGSIGSAYQDVPRTGRRRLRRLQARAASDDYATTRRPSTPPRSAGSRPRPSRKSAKEIGEGRQRLSSSHVWRNAAAGNEGGWAVARTCSSSACWSGAVASVGGTRRPRTNKFVPADTQQAAAPGRLERAALSARVWPLAHHELSFCLPHLIKSGRGVIDTYFTRVYNPVWTNPDGAMWIDMLRGPESLVGCHVGADADLERDRALGGLRAADGPRHRAPRPDVARRRTPRRGSASASRSHACWRSARARQFTWTHEVNPGEVWEEDEFWIALSWKIDPDGELGIREHFESPYRPANASRSTSTTVGSSRTRCRACRRPPSQGRSVAARVHAAPRLLPRARTRSTRRTRRSCRAGEYEVDPELRGTVAHKNGKVDRRLRRRQGAPWSASTP